MNLSEIINNAPSFLLFAFICVCFCSIFFIFVSIPKAINSKNFPVTEGKITSGDVGASRFNGVGVEAEDRAKSYSAYITYKYVVNGKSFTSYKRRWHEAQTTFHPYHKRIADRYPRGKTVNVYYNPNKPQVSVLEPGIGLGSILGILISLGSIAFLVFFISYQYS